MAKLSNTQLTKICLVGFLFSFVLIYFMEEKHKSPLINIENITNSHLNKHIIVHGEIQTQRQSKNTLFIMIKDETGIIDATLFKTNISLEKNQKYFFEGKVQYYKDEFQLIVSNVYSTL